MGRHLIETGPDAGAHLRARCLDELFEAQLDGRISNVDEGLDLARRLLAERAD